MQQQVKKIPVIRWQLANQRVVYALIPSVIASIYFFGLRSLILLVIVSITGFLTEFLFARFYFKEPATFAVFVTSFLFTLSLPPTIPIGIAIMGIIFAVAIGKMAFGGFGRNVFNPALTGRAFIYVSFATPMTASWVEPLSGYPGGFGSFASDTVTKATPLVLASEGTRVPYSSLFFGNTSGCLGETSAILIALGGLYIIWKRAASYRIVISGFLGMMFIQTIFWLLNVKQAIDPLAAILSGGFMLGIFFMATDPVSASQTNPGRWIFGTIVGALTSIIRVFAVWPEGMMFAILLGNVFIPIIDYYIKQSKAAVVEK